MFPPNLKKRTIYRFQILQISWCIHGLFTAEKKSMVLFPRPFSLVFLFVLGNWRNSDIFCKEQKLLYNRKWSLEFSFFPNSCCYDMNSFRTTMKRKRVRKMFEENKKNNIEVLEFFFFNWESRILKIKEESTYKFLFLPVQGYLAKKLSVFLLELPARTVW